MERKRTKTVKLREQAHTTLKALSAIERRPIEEIIEVMVKDYIENNVMRLTDFSKTDK